MLGKPVMPQSRMFREGSLTRYGDGRSRQAKFLRRLKAELLAHLGAQPSLIQQQLVDLAVADRFQMLLFEQRFAAAGRLTPHERREESAVRTRFERTLLRLGLKAAAAPAPTTYLEYAALRSAAGEAA
jgi:hypothetical protein